jgi:hypothetical protein
MIYILFALIGAACHQGATQSLRYDCRLVEGDFEPSNYVKNSSIDSAYTNFNNKVESGVFFIHRYLNDDRFYRALSLTVGYNDVVITNLLTHKKNKMTDSNSHEMRSLIAS